MGLKKWKRRWLDPEGGNGDTMCLYKIEKWGGAVNKGETIPSGNQLTKKPFPLNTARKEVDSHSIKGANTNADQRSFLEQG